MRALGTVVGIVAVGILAGCDSKAPGVSSAGDALRSEGYCSVPAFPPSLRQTIVVIDGRELSHADSAEEIRTRNASVIDAVATIAGKALAPRERLKIVLAPTDGLQPKLLFTGCLPGYSPDELRAAQAKSSAADAAAAEFFGQGASQKAAAALEAFESMAVGALVQAAKAVPEGLKSDAGVPFASSSIVASLHNANSLINLEDGAPRLFVLSDLPRRAKQGLRRQQQPGSTSPERNYM
jgi:hypothetical protein